VIPSAHGHTFFNVASMYMPSSTYRVQLHKDFNFSHLKGIIGYLESIGISTIYASPILKSKAGSMHGYDVLNPHEIDPEIGTLEDFMQISAALKEKKMSWVQDIVPNHMAFHPGNEWLMDVLERGTNSSFYNYFDIDWNHPQLKGKLMVPFLGEELDECIAQGLLAVRFSDAGFTIRYADLEYPVSVQAVQLLATKEPAVTKTLTDYCEKSVGSTGFREWKEAKSAWVADISRDNATRQGIEKLCDSVNKNKTLMRDMMDAQCYVLSYWQLSERMINYRRFFTVNELICLKIEDDAVFQDYHRFLFWLYRENLIQGFRIDHIDGLYDPLQYCQRLRKAVGEDCFIIAEKILEARESMPEHWPLQGTSGYEFLSDVSQLMTDRVGSKKLLTLYQQLVPDLSPYAKIVFLNKKLILEKYMAGELENLVELFFHLGLQEKFQKDHIRSALGFFMISLPVYRIYPDRHPVAPQDITILEETLRRALESSREFSGELEYIFGLFVRKSPMLDGEKILRFLKRMMQFTGPLTAKGVEDTTFYVYNPLISHDEVGDAPSMLGISIQSFHSKMEQRAKNNPFSLNATATHDTKRGEDARLRLNILSEIPDEWAAQVKEWMNMNSQFIAEAEGKRMPTINDEYFIYQSLIGGYTAEDVNPDQFFNRFDDFLIKAIREAKVNSDWAKPNNAYELGCIGFLRSIFAGDHTFKASLDTFVGMISRYAELYAPAQVVIKATAPGIPDIYQGCDLWDLSFVDPDNRRPVDYLMRQHYVEEIVAHEKENSIKFFHYLRSRRKCGVEKMFVTRKILNFRKEYNDIFLYGDYIPLQFSTHEPVAIAFSRHFRSTWITVVVPLALARHREYDHPYAHEPDDRKFFGLPSNAPSRWRNIFTGEELSFQTKITIFDALKDFPVAVFINKQELQKK